MYRLFFKRVLDFSLSLLAIILLSPLFVIFTIFGYFKMKGNPFFVQARPGLKGNIFYLIKFRTMSNEKDKDGNLLPDIQRLNNYGKFLRSTSIDELPELFNILKGDMSIVGPRPLAVQYLPYYNEQEMHRHDVRPGLTGLAQINGRNAVNWPERFTYDLDYVNNLSFSLDISIILKTITKVFKRNDISVRGTTSIKDFHVFRMEELARKESSRNEH